MALVVMSGAPFDYQSAYCLDLAGIDRLATDEDGFVDIVLIEYDSGAHYQFLGGHFDVSQSGTSLHWTRGDVDGALMTYNSGSVDFDDIAWDGARLATLLAARDGTGLWSYMLSSYDSIYGSAFSDRIQGYNGNDVVRGARGSDLLLGGLGNDELLGGPGNDRLDGGAENDKLEGSYGRDVFLFHTRPGAGNIDLIRGFRHADDTIELDLRWFPAVDTVPGQTLAPAEFTANDSGTAHDADDRLIYNRNSGALYYDPDGDGPTARIQIAVLAGAPPLAADDFLIGN